MKQPPDSDRDTTAHDKDNYPQKGLHPRSESLRFKEHHKEGDMNHPTNAFNPPSNTLVRSNTSETLTAVHCALNFISDYVYLTVSRSDTPPNCALVGFFNVMNLITETVEYEVKKDNPNWGTVKDDDIADETTTDSQ